MHSSYLDAIRTFEGFAPQAVWDYAQLTNGYGTRARHPGEVIDRAEADRRFQAAVADARTVVEHHAPFLDEGTKAALTSLTYNAGDAWVHSGLGDAVLRGDLDEVRAIFQEYNKAGGGVAPGLVSRRAAEAQWIGNPDLAGAGAPASGSRSAGAQLRSPEIRAAAALAVSLDAAGRREPQPAVVVGGDDRFTGNLLAVADSPGAGLAGITPLTSDSVSEIARLVKLDSGRELRAAQTDRRAARARAHDA